MARPGNERNVAKADAASSVDSFLERSRGVAAANEVDRGRLIFALDATMSRQPTWDLAQHLQGRMFQIAETHGGLDVQLVYFRGFAECRASRFVSGGAGLATHMSKIDCRGGHTQIGRVLRHTLNQTRRARVGAMIFVGDAMEERLDDLCQTAGELGVYGVKAFMFHEGRDSRAGTAFREIARLTGGAYAAFDATAPGRLAELLAAAAAYAAGGRTALEDAARGNNAARLLLSQMR